MVGIRGVILGYLIQLTLNSTLSCFRNPILKENKILMKKILYPVLLDSETCVILIFYENYAQTFIKFYIKLYKHL